MKRMLAGLIGMVILLSLLVAACASKTPEGPNKGRFTVERVGSDFTLGNIMLIHDTKTGRDYLTTYRGGLVEVTR